MEIWKDIKEYEGLYKVSNLGRIKSLDREVKCFDGTKIINGRFRKLLNKKGYFQINLCPDNKTRKFKFVHRLVAEAFISNPDNKPNIHHINHNSLDNRVENLKWVTQKENNTFDRNIGLCGGKEYQPKKVKCIETGIEYISRFKAAEWIDSIRFKGTKPIKNIARSIGYCANGKQNIAYGYHWINV